MSEQVRLEPMTPEQFPAWAAHSREGFAAQQVASGSAPEAEATAYAEQQFAELLPEGLHTPDTHIWTVHSADTEGAGDGVGHVWISLKDRSEGVEAFVYEVELRPEARGHGLGRATVQAAEAEASRLGASWMRLNVFGVNVDAIRLYDRLGYQPCAAMMTRRLDGHEPRSYDGGPEVLLRPMSRPDYDSYRVLAETEYAANISGSGMLPASEARAKAADDYGSLLRDGLASPGQHLFTGYDGDEKVATLWLHISEKSDGLHAFGYDLSVSEELRRRGYGRAMMVAAERLCRDRGVVSVGLTVFGANRAARVLSEQMGFELSAQLMKKRL